MSPSFALRSLKQLFLVGSFLSVASAAPADTSLVTRGGPWLSATAELTYASLHGGIEGGKVYMSLADAPSTEPKSVDCSIQMGFPGWECSSCSCHVEKGLFDSTVYCDASVVNKHAEEGQPTEVGMTWWGDYFFTSDHTWMHLKDTIGEYSCEPSCEGVWLHEH